MIGAFAALLEERSAALRGAPHQTCDVAGTRVAIRGEPSLLAQMTGALKAAGSTGAEADLTVMLWDGDPSPLELAPREWQVRERWHRREPVRSFPGRSMIYFDPIGGVVTLYDAENKCGALWFEKGDRIRPWITAAPLLRVLDGWFLPRSGFVCHAASIVHDGGAALIVGPGGAGKSTLATSAVGLGYGYVGDDYVLLEAGPEGATVHNLFNSAKLETANLPQVLPAELAISHRPDAGEDKMVFRVARSAIVDSAPLALVVAPRIGRGSGPFVEPISPAQAMKAIMPTALQQLPGSYQDKLEIVSSSLRVPCIRLDLAPSARANLAAIAACLERKDALCATA